MSHLEVPDRLHLLRHGEVHNPGRIVYADLPGYGLSPRGRREARRAAEVVGSVDLVVSSPLLRARQTAAIVASGGTVPIRLDARLTEWGLLRRWAGTAWDEVSMRFPGELEAYHAQPHDLPFSPESLETVARRARAAATGREGPTIVVVSHQDVLQALRLTLIGRPLRELHDGKLGHGEVVTLERHGDAWRETAPPFPG